MSFILAVLMLFSKVGGGEFFKNAVNESFEQNFQNSKAEFNKIWKDGRFKELKKSHEHTFKLSKYERKKSKKKLNDMSEEILNLKAKELLKRINEFIEESDKKGISPENMFDYILKCMNETAGKFKPLSLEEFYLYCNNPNVVRLYRGISGKQYVDDFLNGKFIVSLANVIEDQIFGNSKQGATYGTGIYTSNQYNYARAYAHAMCVNENIKAEWDSGNDAGVIRLAIDKTKFKTISHIVLNKIIYLMFKNNADEILSKILGSSYIENFKLESYHNENCFLPAFKETFGVDFEDVFNRFYLNNNSKDEKFKDNVLSFLYKITYFLCNYRYRENIVYDNENFLQNFSKLMKENEVLPHSLNKFYTVVSNEGLLAKLLGYDCVIIDEGSNTYLILNMDNVAVCTSEESARRSTKSVEELYNYDGRNY